MKPRAPGRYAALALSALLTVSAALATGESPAGPGRAAGSGVDPILTLAIPEAVGGGDPQVSRRDLLPMEKRSRQGPLLLTPTSGATSPLQPRGLSMAHPGTGGAPASLAFRTPLTRAPPTLPAV